MILILGFNEKMSHEAIKVLMALAELYKKFEVNMVTIPK
jgi:hypothetical protein